MNCNKIAFAVSLNLEPWLWYWYFLFSTCMVRQLSRSEGNTYSTHGSQNKIYWCMGFETLGSLMMSTYPKFCMERKNIMMLKEEQCENQVVRFMIGITSLLPKSNNTAFYVCLVKLTLSRRSYYFMHIYRYLYWL